MVTDPDFNASVNDALVDLGCDVLQALVCHPAQPIVDKLEVANNVMATVDLLNLKPSRKIGNILRSLQSKVSQNATSGGTKRKASVGPQLGSRRKRK